MKLQKIMILTLALMVGRAQAGWFGINIANLNAKFSDLGSKISSWATNNSNQATAVAVGAVALASVLGYNYWSKQSLRSLKQNEIDSNVDSSKTDLLSPVVCPQAHLTASHSTEKLEATKSLDRRDPRYHKRAPELPM